MPSNSTSKIHFSNILISTPVARVLLYTVFLFLLFQMNLGIFAVQLTETVSLYNIL